jgi:outer membrane lipoprotein LolB
VRPVAAARAGSRTLLPGLVLALAGCALPPRIDSPALSGRLALTVDAHADRPAQSFSAFFELAGGAPQGELRLSTALGTTIAAARWSPDEAVLVTTEGEQRFADLDGLSRAAFGETLPLGAWPDWLQGRPWPGAPSRPRDDGPGFEQLGWRIDTDAADVGRISAWRPGPPAVHLRARVDRPS